MGDAQASTDAVGGPTGGLKPSRAVGGTLNALVRATALYRRGVERFNVSEDDTDASDMQRRVAERCVKAWRKAVPNALDFEATQVSIDGEVALRADNEYAQWVLYAFMAGVRRIQPRPAMTLHDVIRLVHQLVSLVPTVKSIDGFRDWLDADGAEGFDVRVHTSFREAIEEVDLEEEREFSKAFAMARFEVPRSGDAVYIAARDLDLVAMRKEFEVPIEMYASATMDMAGGMSDDDLKALGARCDDPNAWATMELQAVLTLPELRSAVSPEHMARRVVTRLAEEPDNRFLRLLTRLNSRTDAFQQAVAEALGTEEVGELISRQVDLRNDENIEALGEFLVLSPEPVARAVMTGLLDRAGDDSQGRAAVLSLAEWYGGTQICQWVQAEALDEDRATTLGMALRSSEAAAPELTRIVSGTSLDASLSLLQSLPASAMGDMGRALRFMWSRTEPERQEDLAGMMIKGAAKDNLTLLGDMLNEGKLDKWKGQTLYALCAALVQAGLGRSHVLELAMRRSAPEQVRVIAIDCLRHDAELAAEACRFRVSRVFDSSTIRERFKRLDAARRTRGDAS